MSGYCDRCGNTMCVCSTADLRADEWRWGYLNGYLHGWADHKAGRQYGEGRYPRHRVSLDDGDAWGRASAPGPGEPGDASDAT